LFGFVKRSNVGKDYPVINGGKRFSKVLISQIAPKKKIQAKQKS
jgi:hypothetical protein